MLSFFLLQLTTAATSPKITWSACPPAVPPGVDCGSINVPLSYQSGNSTDAAGNGTVTLVLTRLNATGNSTENGGNRPALFFNPGGPGVPATSVVAAGNFVPNLGFSSAVREEYDIIGLDPRGVGQSTPVWCDPNVFNERVPTLFIGNNLGGSRNSSARYQALVNHNRRLGESCANLTGPLLDNLDTIHVVKDHELVRRALGANRFNYFGMSYGSLMGQQYLTLFPHSVGRMALDGLIDHSQSEVSTLLTESTTYETTLNKFFQWCDTNSTCPLHQGKGKGGSHGNNTKAMFEALLARADMTAIPAPSCNGSCQPNATGEDIRYNVQNFLDFVDLSVAPNWIDLGGALEEAINGNATALSTPLGTSETSASIMGSPFSYLAIGCQDWLRRERSVTDLTQRLQAVRPFAPLTAGASQTYYYQSTCIGWPANVTNGQAPLNTTRLGNSPPRVLLSNSVYDPSCSIVWADGLRQQLPGAVSITRNGSGHTSHFLLGGETRGAIDNYLATGKLPMDGTIYQT